MCTRASESKPTVAKKDLTVYKILTTEKGLSFYKTPFLSATVWDIPSELTPITDGKDHLSYRDDGGVNIYGGFIHSFPTKKDADRMLQFLKKDHLECLMDNVVKGRDYNNNRHYLSQFVVVKARIPKGVEYFEGVQQWGNNYIPSMASRKLRMDKICRHRDVDWRQLVNEKLQK